MLKTIIIAAVIGGFSYSGAHLIKTTSNLREYPEEVLTSQKKLGCITDCYTNFSVGYKNLEMPTLCYGHVGGNKINTISELQVSG